MVNSINYLLFIILGNWLDNIFSINNNGIAYISIERVADMCGVTINNLLQSCKRLNIDYQHGIDDEGLSNLVILYSEDGNLKSIESLVMLARVGSFYYILN